jgi:hypothetical protein
MHIDIPVELLWAVGALLLLVAATLLLRRFLRFCLIVVQQSLPTNESLTASSLQTWCEDTIDALSSRQDAANIAINEMLEAQGQSLSLLNERVEKLVAGKSAPVRGETLPGGIVVPMPAGEPHFEGLDEHVREIVVAQQTKKRLPLFEDIPIQAMSEREREVRTLLSNALNDAPESTCIKCNNWDFRRGQKELQANPSFMEAARWLTPNQMGQKNIVDGEGNSRPDPDSVRFPAIFDTWELFGLCKDANKLTNAVDTCPAFDPRG